MFNDAEKFVGRFKVYVKIFMVMCFMVVAVAASACNTLPDDSYDEITSDNFTTVEEETTTEQTTEGVTAGMDALKPSDTVVYESIYDDGGEPALVFTSAYAEVGSELTVVLKNVENREDFSYTWRVGQKQVCKEQSYTPSSSDLEKFIKVTAKNGTESYTAKIYFSELPVVYIDTENKQEITDKETYISAACHIQGNKLFDTEQKDNAETWNTAALYSGDIKIKGRGNASWTLGEREGKKPYKIKLDSKADLFGMGESKHWVLLADWNDKTAIRNIITNDFSKAVGMEYSMELTSVVLIFNGEYEGLYEMGEQVRVEKARVDIFDWEDLAKDAAKKIAKKNGLDDETRDGLEDVLVRNLSWATGESITYKGSVYNIGEYVDIPGVDGGYLLEVDMYYDTVSKFMTDGNTSDEYDAQPVMFKSPEYAYTNQEMFSYVKTNINNFEQAVRSSSHYYEAYDGVKMHYSDIVDMDSLVSYWLVNELSNNFDSMKNSLFIYKDYGDKFKFGPAWDYDLAFGNKEPNAAKFNEWQTLFYNKNHQAYQWYKYLIQDPYFLVQAYELYHEKASPYIDQLISKDGKLDSLLAYTERAGLANLKKWPTGKHEYKTEVSKLTTYINNRKEWLDKQFKTVEGLVSSLRSYKASSDLVIRNIEGSSFEIDVKNANVKKLLVIINGRMAAADGTAYAYEVSLDGGATVISVDAEYKKEAGRLNVIEVFGLDASGEHILYGGQAMKNYLVFE